MFKVISAIFEHKEDLSFELTPHILFKFIDVVNIQIIKLLQIPCVTSVIIYIFPFLLLIILCLTCNIILCFSFNHIRLSLNIFGLVVIFHFISDVFLLLINFSSQFMRCIREENYSVENVNFERK